MKKNSSVLYFTETGVLTALGVVLMYFVRFPLLPSFSFLEYDMGDIAIVVITMLLGLQYGWGSLIFIAGIQALTVSASSSWEGFLMHVFATGTYITVLWLIARKKRTAARYVTGFVAGGIMMTAIMIPLNLVFTPLYLHVPTEAVTGLILPAILPFNALKALIHSAVSLALVPALYSVLQKSKLLPEKKAKEKNA